MLTNGIIHIIHILPKIQKCKNIRGVPFKKRKFGAISSFWIALYFTAIVKEMFPLKPKLTSVFSKMYQESHKQGCDVLSGSPCIVFIKLKQKKFAFLVYSQESLIFFQVACPFNDISQSFDLKYSLLGNFVITNLI